MAFSRLDLGHGVGLRSRHYAEWLDGVQRVDWVEAVTENFAGIGGRPLAVLAKVRRDVPVVLHGVSLSLGGTDPLDARLLRELRELLEAIEPAYVSDHLCWGAHRGRYLHDLLPLPYTEEALRNVVSRIEQVQDALGRQILVENVSSYATFQASEMTEHEFLSEVARRADCGILLDVNNVYVSARNHGFDAREYLRGVPVDRVGQFHLAGHSDHGGYLLDTHDAPVADPVWNLYREAVLLFGKVPALIEWDDHLPELARVVEESRSARRIEAEALAVREAA
jgi:uncharacterized protein (UPF0276 family)